MMGLPSGMMRGRICLHGLGWRRSRRSHAYAGDQIFILFGKLVEILSTEKFDSWKSACHSVKLIDSKFLSS